MFLAIERVSKFTHVEFHDCAGKMEGAAFLRSAVEVFPTRSMPCSPTTVWGSGGRRRADIDRSIDRAGSTLLV
jgi:hypothetical protein